ncbi:MAG: hypothetical protein R3266_05045 [Gemmatimonadota bacterium]|nr:hypothetical protein [Gemmatimonadota bacterium]
MITLRRALHALAWVAIWTVGGTPLRGLHEGHGGHAGVPGGAWHVALEAALWLIVGLALALVVSGSRRRSG